MVKESNNKGNTTGSATPTGKSIKTTFSIGYC